MSQSKVIITSGPIGTGMLHLLPSCAGSLSMAEMASLPYRRPDILEILYDKYIAAGASMLLCATLTANAQYPFCRTAEDLRRSNNTVVSLARQSVVKGNRDVALCAMLSLLPSDDNREGCRRVAEQVRLLLDEGMNSFMLETLTDFDRARYLADTLMNVAHSKGVWVDCHISFTPRDGKTLYDNVPVAEAATAMMDYNPSSLGINCILPTAENISAIDIMHCAAPSAALSLRPCATLGDVKLSAVEMVEAVAPYVDGGKVKIAGPCCGGDESFVAAMYKKFY